MSGQSFLIHQRDALMLHHNRFERFQGLFDIAADIPNDDFWHLFRTIVSATGVLFPHQELIRRMLTDERVHSTGRLAAFSEEDREFCKRTLRRGGMLKVYRGADDENLAGFAWTTNKTVAREYALHSAFDNPTIVVGRLKPSHILMAMTDESTIFAFPENVTVERVEEVGSKLDEQRHLEHRMQVLIAAHGPQHVMEMTQEDYLVHAISTGHVGVGDMLVKMKTAQRSLTAFGFVSRLATVESCIAKLEDTYAVCSAE